VCEQPAKSPAQWVQYLKELSEVFDALRKIQTAVNALE
jgi:hypothetical protein